jgi:hypothetical protein
VTGLLNPQADPKLRVVQKSEFWRPGARAVFDKLRALRRDGESYPDVILRLVEIEAG